MRIGVRWHTGATEERAVARPGPGRTPDAALEVIRRHGFTAPAPKSPTCSRSRLTAGKGKPFTAGGVARVRDAYRIFGPRSVALSASTDRTCSPTRYRAGSSRRLTLPLGQAPPWSVLAAWPARGG
jgi:hypothetical protein